MYLQHKVFFSANFQHHQAGLTLLELLIVIVILNIFLAIAYPNLMAQIDKAHYTQAIVDMKCIANEIESSYLERGVFPVEVSGNTKPSGIGCFPISPQDKIPFDSMYDYDIYHGGNGKCYIQIVFYGKNGVVERPQNTIVAPKRGLYYYRDLALGIDSDDLILSLGVLDVPCQ